MSVVRWRPFDELVSLRDAMDRLFEESFVRPWVQRADYTELPVNVWEDKDALHVVARVPGLEADDLDISISGDTLTIRGRFSSDAEQKDAKEWCWYANELWYGTFGRTINLPVLVQSDKVDAQVKNGVLYLTLPKAEEVKPKTIKVKVAK